jgi:hypothetical protein
MNTKKTLYARSVATTFWVEKNMNKTKNTKARTVETASEYASSCVGLGILCGCAKPCEWVGRCTVIEYMQESDGLFQRHVCTRVLCICPEYERSISFRDTYVHVCCVSVQSMKGLFLSETRMYTCVVYLSRV